MEQIIEFIGNHPLLVFAFVATLGVLVYTEMNRVTSGVKNVTPYTATQMLNAGDAVFVDVRDDAEYKKGHVIEARNVPVSGVDKHLHELEKIKDKDIVVYCDTGMRSQKVARILKKKGFEKTHNLAGGVVAWEKASLPLVTR